jgi:hypothetical protein
MISFLAAPYERSLSVTMTRGARPCFFRSLRSRRLAAFLSRRHRQLDGLVLPVWWLAGMKGA